MTSTVAFFRILGGTKHALEVIKKMPAQACMFESDKKLVRIVSRKQNSVLPAACLPATSPGSTTTGRKRT